MISVEQIELRAPGLAMTPPPKGKRRTEGTYHDCRACGDQKGQHRLIRGLAPEGDRFGPCIKCSCTEWV